MSDTPALGAGTQAVGGGTQAAIDKMSAVFDTAILNSQKITELTTTKKTELDATKQRPQN